MPRRSHGAALPAAAGASSLAHHRHAQHRQGARHVRFADSPASPEAGGGLRGEQAAHRHARGPPGGGKVRAEYARLKAAECTCCCARVRERSSDLARTAKLLCIALSAMTLVALVGASLWPVVAGSSARMRAVDKLLAGAETNLVQRATHCACGTAADPPQGGCFAAPEVVLRHATAWGRLVHRSAWDAYDAANARFDELRCGSPHSTLTNETIELCAALEVPPRPAATPPDVPSDDTERLIDAWHRVRRDAALRFPRTSITPDEFAQQYVCGGAPAVLERCGAVMDADPQLLLRKLAGEAVAGAAEVDALVGPDLLEARWTLHLVHAHFFGPLSLRDMPLPDAVAALLPATFADGASRAKWSKLRGAEGHLKARRDGFTDADAAAVRGYWQALDEDAQRRGGTYTFYGEVSEASFRPSMAAWAKVLNARWRCRSLGSRMDHWGGSFSTIQLMSQGVTLGARRLQRAGGSWTLQVAGTTVLALWPTLDKLFTAAGPAVIESHPGDVVFVPAGWVSNATCTSSLCVAMQI